MYVVHCLIAVRHTLNLIEGIMHPIDDQFRRMGMNLPHEFLTFCFERYLEANMLSFSHHDNSLPS